MGRRTRDLHVPAVEILYIQGLGHNSSFSHLSNAHPAKVHAGTYSLDGLHTRCSVGQARGGVNVMKSHRLQLCHNMFRPTSSLIQMWKKQHFNYQIAGIGEVQCVIVYA